MRTSYPPERGAGVRLGGVIDWRQVGTTRGIWTGRPPVMPDGTPLQTLALGAESQVPGQSVTVTAQAGTQWGGYQTRVFQVGGGQTAYLRIGSFETVDVKVITECPENFRLRFAWSTDWSTQPSPLYHYLDYPTLATAMNLPQGAESIFPQNACVITWEMLQFATTHTVAVPAGVELPVRWGTFSCGIANQFIVKLRGF